MNEILDTPFSNKPLPPKNAIVLLFIVLTMIVCIPVLFYILSTLDMYVIKITNNNVGEFIRDIPSNDDTSGDVFYTIEYGFETIFLKNFTKETFKIALSTGSVLGILFAIAFGIITKVRGDFLFVWKKIKIVFGIIIGCWILCALSFQLSLESSDEGFLIYPWLIGASLGRLIGCVFGSFFFIIKIYFDWKKEKLSFSSP